MTPLLASSHFPFCWLYCCSRAGISALGNMRYPQDDVLYTAAIANIFVRRCNPICLLSTCAAIMYLMPYIRHAI